MIVTKELPGVRAGAQRRSRLRLRRGGRVRCSKSADVLEYWRSSPYVLELMDAYQVKKRLEAAAMGATGRSPTLWPSLARD